MKILFLTDIHSGYDRITNLLSFFKQLNPDLILVGGDFENRKFAAMNEPGAIEQNEKVVSDFISQLQHVTNKVYFVLGNHDAAL